MTAQLSRKPVEDSPAIPDRLYFKIGDVARICGVEAYVLRFWESQFPQLKPNKSGTGQRLYRRRDVELVLEIKRLVHGMGYTLAGARQALDQAQRRPGKPHGPQKGLGLAKKDAEGSRDAVATAVGRTRAELREIAGMLAAPVVIRERRRPRFATTLSGELFPS